MGIAERKERERQQRREEIIKAAEEIFFSRGTESATMDEVAERAELSKGTLYLYFKSKEDFGLELIDYFAPHFSKLAQKHLRSAEKLYLKKISLFFDEFQSFFEAQSCKMGCPIGNLVLEMGDLNENFRRKLDEVMESMKRSVFEF